MPTPSLAFILVAGSLALATSGLCLWNLSLHRRLRATCANNHEPVAPLEPPPVATPDKATLPCVEPVASSIQAEPSPLQIRERELQGRLEQAEHQLQLVQQELAALSYSVSHDLRAPLRAIDGFSQALAEDYGHVLDATAQGYLQRVRVNTRQMVSLIEDLLALSRLTRAPLQREVIEIGPMVDAIIARLRKSEPERLVTIEVQPGLRAFADRHLLESILQHLVGNAWKFTSRRLTAHVSLRAASMRQENGSREIVYEVRDDGAGFDMNYAGKLFGAFQRMHGPEEFPGNGIGLASVQRIVRRHSGRVWAEAVPDHGTAIFFTLGAEEEAAKLLLVGEPAIIGESATSGKPESAAFSITTSPVI